MLEIIGEYITQFFDNKPQLSEQDFYYEISYYNLSRLKFLLSIFSFILLIFTTMQYFKEGDGSLLRFQAGVVVFMLILLFGIYRKTSDDGDIANVSKLWFYMGSISPMLWFVFRAGIQPRSVFSLVLFTVSLFFISVLFYWKWQGYLFIWGGLTAGVLLLNYIYATGNIDLPEKIIMMGNIFILGFIFSRVNYISFIKDFEERKKIENEYKELEKKNRRLQSLLEEKTDEIKNFQQQVEELKSRFNRSLKEGNIGYWEWNISGNRVIYHKQWARILKYSVDRLDGRLETWQELIHPEDRDEFNHIKDKITNGEIDSFELSHRLRTGEGKWKNVISSGEVLEKDEHKKPIKVSGVLKDNDQKVSLRKDIDFFKDLFGEVLGAMPFGVMLYFGGKWEYVNQTAADILRYSRKDLLNSDYWGFINSDTEKSLNKKDTDNFRNIKFITGDKKEKWVNFYAAKMQLKNRTAVMIVFKTLE